MRAIVKMKYTSNKKLTPNAKSLRKNMTEAERKLWYDVLKKFPVTINRQKVIGNYIVDFCCYSKKIIVEVDGGQHYEEEKIKDDEKRTKYLEGLGYKVLRYSNYDVIKNIDGVYEDLSRHLGFWKE